MVNTMEKLIKIDKIELKKFQEFKGGKKDIIIRNEDGNETWIPETDWDTFLQAFDKLAHARQKYIILEPTEVLQEGDEYFSFNDKKWTRSNNVGSYPNGLAYRREAGWED